MNLVRRVFSSSQATPSLPISEPAVSLNHTLSGFRWHLDSRPSSKVILVHDLFGSSVSWHQLLHNGLSRLPLSRLTPTSPLELHAVELRGHNHSLDLEFPKGGGNYTLASAADVVLHQKQIVRTNAMLVGLGFGALVASQAALHSPDTGFDSLTLFVNGPSQLVSCDPSCYSLPSIVQAAAREVKSLGDFEEYMKKIVPNAVERSLIFATTEQSNGGVRFRFSDELLKMRGPLRGDTDMDEGVKFGKRVTVVHCGKEEFPQEAKDRFLKHFPSASFLEFEGDRTAGIAGLYTQSEAFVHSFLNALEMLGKMEEGDEYGN